MTTHLKSQVTPHTQDYLNKVFNEAQDFYRTIRRIYEESGYDKVYPLGGHWITNTRNMIEIIQKETDPLKKIAIIHETVMFSLNTSDEDIKKDMLHWYVQFFQDIEHSIESLPETIQESIFSNPNNSMEYKGRLVSPDFLRTVAICNTMQKVCDFPQQRFTVMELGAGYGGLARCFKLYYPDTTTIISDIPETMYFSYIFARLNFPEANIRYVTDDNDFEGDISQYDYLFVPTKFAKNLEGVDITLFYNTASLGEMKNEVILEWVDFIQSKANVKYFYGLNRYLNTIDPVHDHWRLDENRCSVSFDDKWDVKHWDMDPQLSRCPYLETLVSRNLEIILERKSEEAYDPESNKQKSDELVKQIEKQDWFTHPGVVNTRIQFGDTRWPFRHTRADNMLTPDFTRNGTLYALWESIRLNPNKNNVSMMIVYLEYLSAKWPFEEIFFYQELLETLDPDYQKQVEVNQAKENKLSLHKILKRCLPQRLKNFLRRMYYGA